MFTTEMYVWVNAYMGIKLWTRFCTRHGCHCLLSAGIFEEGPCLTHMADGSHNWFSNNYVVMWPGLKDESLANLEQGYQYNKSVTHDVGVGRAYESGIKSLEPCSR